MSARHLLPLCLLASLGFAGAVQADDEIKISSCQTISAPGSYVLSKNVTADPKTLQSVTLGTGSYFACLMITADNVALDLAGFTVAGDTTPSTYGVYGAVTGAVIRNGTISGFTASGILLTGGGRHTVENVRAIGNGGAGIALTGSLGDAIGSAVRNNTAAGNLTGFNIAQQGSRVSGNVATGNSKYGLIVICPASVTGNVAFGNVLQQIRLTVINNNDGSPVFECTAANNNPAP